MLLEVRHFRFCGIKRVITTWLYYLFASLAQLKNLPITTYTRHRP